MNDPNPTPPRDPSRVATPVVVQMAGGAAVRIIEADACDPPAHDSGLEARTPVACGLFTPGHNVHMIQVRLAVGTPSTAFDVLGADGRTVTVREQGRADSQTWWLHDTEPVRAALLLDEHPVVYLHGRGMARIGANLLYPCTDGAPEPCSRPAGPSSRAPGR